MHRHMSKPKPKPELNTNLITKPFLSNPSPDGLRPASGFPPISIATSQVKRKGFKSNPLVRRSTGPTTRPVKLNPLKSKVSTTRIPPHRQKDRQEVVENTMHVIGPINEHLPHYLPVFTSNLLISWDENNLKFICTNVENSGISGTGKSEMSALGEFILERARVMKGG